MDYIYTRTLKPFLFSLTLFFSLQASGQEQLIHYWNFNDNTSVETLLAASVTIVPGASITHIEGGASVIDFAGGTGQNFNAENLNARNGDEAGAHLRINNPIGGELEFALPTTGYQNVVVRFATRRSGSGAGLQHWSYTTDGITYSPFATIAPVDGNPVLETLDFTAIAEANDNADFRLRVAFEEGSGGAVGNNRFDNFTLDAFAVGGGDLTPPVVTFSPLNQTKNVPVTVRPKIVFNEPVRLIDNSPIDDSNVSALVELRLNDASGAPVPFTAFFANNEITIVPDEALANYQQYYVALAENAVEDFSDNAVASVQSAQLTTIALQTEFNAGDLVFVAYRMNATSTEDEIALLTFVDINAGTFVNLTDAKYTSNAQPQCPGGIVWTAPENECVPSGTVITIQTETFLTNTGTVTGSGFGLSSGGDQVIVYTGTPAGPHYITALTSNGWVADNTSCGGSLSMIPDGLTDGINTANLSAAPGNVAGNSVNAYYDGVQTGTPEELRTAILDPANWVAVPGSTPPQVWPAYTFPRPPSINGAELVDNSTIRLVFSTALDALSAQDADNYAGIPGLQSVDVTSEGTYDVVTLSYSEPFASFLPYTLTVSGISGTTGLDMSCPFDFSFELKTQVAFASRFMVTEEGDGVLDLVVNITDPFFGSVDLLVLGAPHSTAGPGDFVLASQTLHITDTTTSIHIPVEIVDDNTDEQAAEYFILAMRNPVSCRIAGDPRAAIYIKDNDRSVPVPNKDIELLYVGSFDPSGTNNSTCEIVAYDPASRRLYTTSAIAGFLDIVDFSEPATPSLVASIDINPFGGVTSVAVRDGIVAVASPNAVDYLEGSVLFFDIDGILQNQVTVGVLPDMILFTHDGTKVLTANEGQPTQDYSIDPEGSVSIIDISGGIANLAQGDVTTLDFTAFNAQEAALIASGVRKTYAASTLSQDLEPEYIALSDDDLRAWVTLQEGNSIAEIDLQSLTVTDIWPLGTKDFSVPGNGFDASDNNSEVLIANWPVNAYFIPDALAYYSVGGGHYIVTANEGDEKEYAAFVERTTVGDQGYVLDPDVFPDAASLKQSFNLGRFRVTSLNGDTDGDGDYDEIYCVGTRSFTIWDADHKTLVYDSGDDFERYTSTAPSISALFNSDHESNSFKNRSRSKGPEPEGVTVTTISGRSFAFISLERIGGVMVYDVTDPQDVKFVDYNNARSVSAYEGDHGPEGILHIPAVQSPDGKDYIIVANEISGTLTFYEIRNNIVGVHTVAQGPLTLNAFPNPASGLVYLNRMADVEVVDGNGRTVYQGQNRLTLDVSGYAPGLYTVRASDGAVARLAVIR